MDNTNDQQIVPGLSVTDSGEATVDPSLAPVLIDLALKLEEPANLPVDVEHILAAIVLAARCGQLNPDTQLTADDPQLAHILLPHVRTIFADYKGKVGRDD